MHLLKKVKARLAEMKQQAADRMAKNKKQVNVRERTKYLSEKTNYVRPDEGTRKRLSDELSRNTDEKGRAQPSSYKPKKTPPKKSPSIIQSLRARAGGFLESAMNRKNQVSKQATQDAPSKKHTSGLSKGG